MDDYLRGLQKFSSQADRTRKTPAFLSPAVQKKTIFEETRTEKWVRYEQEVINEARRMEYENHILHSGDSAYEKPYINQPSSPAVTILLATLA